MSYTQPPPVLQIFREFLKPGTDDEYRSIEDEQKRICVELKCPHPYLGIESLTGPKEVWFFNGYTSLADVKQVEADYARNAPLLEALQPNGKRKAALMFEPIDVLTTHRRDSSRGAPWSPGQGRFLVITVTRRDGPFEGTVFEAPDGTRFIVVPAQTRDEAEADAAAAGPEARVFAVRPNWSFPAEEWIAADPAFWRTPPH